MAYELSMLGTVRLRDETGQDVRIPRGKPLALLCYLALHPEGAARSELGDLLWRGKTESRARQSVRQALLEVRQRLGELALEGEDPVRLAVGAVRVDAERMRRAVDAREVERALNLWRGEPFGDLSISGAPAWDEWVSVTGRELREVLAVAVEAGALEHEAEDRPDDAIRILERLAELQPRRAPAWAHLIRLLGELGRTRDARLSVAEARAVLPPEVFEEWLGPLDTRLSVAAAVEQAGGDGGAEDLLGRAEALKAVSAAWREAARSGATGVLLVGEPGVGKTRMLQEASSPMLSPGATPLRVACPELGGEPWALGRRIVDELARLPGGGEIRAETRELLASMGGEGMDLSGLAPAARAAVSAGIGEALVEALSTVARTRPILLLLDDLHAADEASVAALEKLLHLRPAVPLAVVGTWSPGVSGPSSARLASWEEAELVRARALAPLTPDDVLTLLRRYELEAYRVADDLIRLGGGLVAVVRHFADGLSRLEREGRLPSPEEASLSAVPVSDRVEALLRFRVRACSADAVRVLGALRMDGTPVDDVAAPQELAELREAGLVRVEGGRVWPLHPALLEAMTTVPEAPEVAAPEVEPPAPERDEDEEEVPETGVSDFGPAVATDRGPAIDSSAPDTPSPWEEADRLWSRRPEWPEVLPEPERVEVHEAEEKEEEETEAPRTPGGPRVPMPIADDTGSDEALPDEVRRPAWRVGAGRSEAGDAVAPEVSATERPRKPLTWDPWDDDNPPIQAPEGARRRPQTPLFPRAMLIPLGVLVIGVAAILWLRFMGSPFEEGTDGGAPSDFGSGGQVVFLAADAILAGRPGEGDLQLRPPVLPIPVEARLPHRTVNGRLAWFRATEPGESPGEILEETAGLPMRTMVSLPTPVELLAVAPGGGAILYTTEVEDGLRHVWIARGLGFPVQRVAEDVGDVVFADWSPDVARILVATATSLRVVRPDGEAVKFLDLSLVAPRWCGGHRTAVGVTPGEPAALVRLDVGSGQLTALASVDHIGGPACSPDGASVALLERRADGVSLVLRSTEDGSVTAVVPGLSPQARSVRWVPDQVAEPAAVVRVSPEILTLPVGESTIVDARVVLTDGRELRDGLEWRASDPEIAAVADDGTVSALAPGTTFVRAMWEGWASGSVQVTVTSDAGGGSGP